MVDLGRFGVNKGEGRIHEEIVYSLALLYYIVGQRLENFLKQYDLTTGKLNILMTVKHQGGLNGIRQVEISKHLIVTPSNMTKMIDKLEKDALVERIELKGDRRVNIIKITAKGSRLLDTLWVPYNNHLKEAVSGFSPMQQKQLAGLLGEWLAREH